MSRTSEAEGDTARRQFLSLLRTAQERSQRIAFWWRDDDAKDATPELNRLLVLADRFGLPLALAVVPKGATAALAERLCKEAGVWVLQHGWQHRAHNPEGEKKTELGDHRPLTVVRDELRAGFLQLEAEFSQFLPVLVPPWNRISDAVRAEAKSVGLLGLSAYGRHDNGAHWVNTHLDIFAWKPARHPIERAQAYSILCGEMEDRLSGNAEPIGILSHHLIHENASWVLLEELFGVLAGHPAIAWPAIPDLLDLPRR